MLGCTIYVDWVILRICHR